MKDRKEYAEGLRMLAALAETTDLPMPTNPGSVPVVAPSDEAELARLDQIAATLAAAGFVVERSESAGGAHRHVTVSLGSVKYRATAISREHMAAYKAMTSYDGAVTP